SGTSGNVPPNDSGPAPHEAERARRTDRRDAGGACYLTVTVAPAPSRAAFALSAASLLTFSRTVAGVPSTRSLASLRPRLVSARTSLMTWIFLSPEASRTTSNSSCSSASAGAAAPPPAAGAAATATGAAAVTPKVSSNCLTNSLSSISVISLNASSSSSVLSFAMVAFPSVLGPVRAWVCGGYDGRSGLRGVALVRGGGG